MAPLSPKPSIPWHRAGFFRLLHFHPVGCGQGGGAAVSGSQDDLLGVFPPQVTDNENSRKVSFALFIGLDVAVVIHPDAGRNQLVIGTEADEDEHSIHGQFPGVASLGALESYGVDSVRHWLSLR